MSQSVEPIKCDHDSAVIDNYGCMECFNDFNASLLAKKLEMALECIQSIGNAPITPEWITETRNRALDVYARLTA